MTRDQLRERFRQPEVPDPKSATMPEINRLLATELPSLIFRGRALEELEMIRQFAILIQMKRMRVSQDFIVYLYGRTRLLVWIGVLYAGSIEGGTDLAGDVVRDGVSREVFEEQVIETLGVMIDF